MSPTRAAHFWRSSAAPDRRVLTHPLVGHIAATVLALFWAALGFHVDTGDSPFEFDAPRHAMNGAFVYDLARSSALESPVEYGQAYYSRLPAVSLPYHPPLFPAMEAVFYAVLGVHLAAARLAVALMVAVSCYLFYRLVLATHGSVLPALLCPVVLFSLGLSRQLAGEVMLEFPSLVFVLSAVWFLRHPERGLTDREACLFALCGAAAVWTKQHAVFLGFMPFLLVLLTRRWELLRARAIWLGTALFAAATLALGVLSFALVSTPSARWWERLSLTQRTFVNVAYYLERLSLSVGLGWFLCGMAGFVALSVVLVRREHLEPARLRVYVAWLAAVCFLLVVIPPRASRYLFYLYPPLIALGLAWLSGLGRLLLGQRRAWSVPVAVTAVWLALTAPAPAHFLLGPREAARVVLEEKTHRVLFCGRELGAFVFGVRSLDEQGKSVVIAGEKLPAEVYQPQEFERFAREFGIQAVVLQVGQPAPWDGIVAAPVPSLTHLRTVPLHSTVRARNGELRIYRVLNPSLQPRRHLRIFSHLAGREIDLRF